MDTASHVLSSCCCILGLTFQKEEAGERKAQAPPLKRMQSEIMRTLRRQSIAVTSMVIFYTLSLFGHPSVIIGCCRCLTCYQKSTIGMNTTTSVICPCFLLKFSRKPEPDTQTTTVTDRQAVLFPPHVTLRLISAR